MQSFVLKNTEKAFTKKKVPLASFWWFSTATNMHSGIQWEQNQMWQVFSAENTHIWLWLWPHNNFSPLSWSQSFLSNLSWHLNTVLLHPPFFLFPSYFLIYFCYLFIYISICAHSGSPPWTFFSYFVFYVLSIFSNSPISAVPPILPTALFSLIISSFPYHHSMANCHSALPASH